MNDDLRLAKALYFLSVGDHHPPRRRQGRSQYYCNYPRRTLASH